MSDADVVPLTRLRSQAPYPPFGSLPGSRNRVSDADLLA